MGLERVDGDRWGRWVRWWTAAGIPGSFLSVLIWGVSDVLVVSTLMVATAGCCQALALLQSESGGTTGQVIGSCARAGCSTALMVLGLGGIGAVSGSTVFVVVVLALASTPVVVDLARKAVGSAAGHEEGSGRLVITTAPALLSAMTTPELCRAWRRSFATLQDAVRLDDRIRVVALRQAYLDEIEARDAHALASWLQAGARAAGGPDRFLGPPARRPPDAA